MQKVIFTFDDSVKNHLDFVAPLLKSYNFGATFFVGSFPCAPEEPKEFMNWSDCAELFKLGFDVGNHTLTHADLSQLSREQQITEIESVENELQKVGVPKPLSFAYPCCKYNSETLDILREKRYLSGRIGGEQLYDEKCTSALLVPSFPVHGGSDERFFAGLKRAEKTAGTVVMMFHGVPDRIHPWVDTPVELFERYCEYLKQNDYFVGSMRDI